MAKPFIKWPGGKAKLLPIIESLLPKERFTSYYEPFLGGGAVFFRMEELFRLGITYYLNDLNSGLMQVYSFLQSSEHIENLCAFLVCVEKENKEEFYYMIRNEFNNRSANTVDYVHVGKFIYLNRTCFNGLFRVNSNGKFNVPYGHYKNPKVAIIDLLSAAHKVFTDKDCHITLSNTSYRHALAPALTSPKEAFIYLDPPYHPVLDKPSFTAYTAEGFGEQDQLDLAATLRELDSKGARWMLSNSNTDFIKNLYKNFDITPVTTTRTIARSTRNVANEVLIRNYT